MFGKRLKLFTMFGFSVYVDASWIIIAVFITWSFATMFTSDAYRFPQRTAWYMGVAGALGLFASIVLHELCHSLVARRYGLPMKGITLFIFGGVAEMSDEPQNAKVEFLMAIAGPAMSFAIGAACHGVLVLGRQEKWPLSTLSVFDLLSRINVALAIFNLIPGFPLDGGRVLRAILWQIKGNLRWATQVAAGVGSAFGTFLIVLGLVTAVMTHDLVGSIWLLLIGMFIRGAASQSYQQVVVRQNLQGEPVRRFMTTNVITVRPETTLAELVEHYIYNYHHKFYPVVRDDQLVGCVTVRDVRQVPREEWPTRTVGEIAAAPCADNTIAPDHDALDALTMINRTGASRLMVVEDGRVVGIVSLKDLLAFLSLKLELEEGVTPPPPR